MAELGSDLGFNFVDIWRKANELDLHPGDWTYPLFAHRSVVSLVKTRVFYEILSDYGTILAICHLNERLADAHCPSIHMQGIGVVLEVFPSMFDAPEGRLPMPKPDEQSLGDHAVAIVGWDDDGASLVFGNSYGPAWSDNGRGLLTKQYADRFIREASTLRVGTCGPNHKNWDEVFVATGSDLARAWVSSEKAVVGQVELENRRFEYRFYPVVSFNLGCYVEVIEIRSDSTCDREGWAHLYHLPFGSDRRSVLRELFVLPAARLRGLGRALELVATERAVDRGSHVIQLDLNEADAYGSSMQAARAFAVRCGYTWTEGANLPGSVNSYAEKRLVPDISRT